MDTGEPIFYAVAISGTLAVAGRGVGLTAAFIPELFATRYSGRALAQSLAGVAGSAVSPGIAGPRQATCGGSMIGLMLAILTAVSVVCTYLLPEINGTVLQSIRGADSRHSENPQSRMTYTAPREALRHTGGM